MEVDEGAEAVIVNVGEVVVLKIENLKIVLRRQNSVLQLAERVEAQIQRHQLLQVREDVVGEEVAGDVIVRHVEEQELTETREEFTGE